MGADKFVGYVLVAGFDANSFMLVKNPLIRFLVNMFMNLLNTYLVCTVERITQVYCELFELVSNLSNFSLKIIFLVNAELTLSFVFKTSLPY
jgi:hypothetical protein